MQVSIFNYLIRVIIIILFSIKLLKLALINCLILIQAILSYNVKIN